MTQKKDLFFLDGPHGKIAALSMNWNADNKARLILAHGYSASASMSEHAKLFIETGEKAAAQGIGSFLFDFTGNGVSDGYFKDISPNRRIAELTSIIDFVRKDYNGPLFLLGLSMGGAVSVHAACLRESALKGLITWSCVPTFDAKAQSAHWYPAQPDSQAVESPGDVFYKERPEKSVAECYAQLRIPKLQIQGDQDFAFFKDEFEEFFPKAQEPKKHIVLSGGDHVFTNRGNRDAAIGETLDWIKSV